MNALPEAAAWYAAQGIPIFPIRPAGKQPATAHGFKDATTDPAKVRAWWPPGSRRNIAMPTGVLFDVLDLDMRDHCDAAATRDTLESSGWLEPACGEAVTRNGGRHLFYPTGGGPSTAIRALGIDWKAQGGYVLLPPSFVWPDRATGDGNYRWEWFRPGIGSPLRFDLLREQYAPPPPRPVTDWSSRTGDPAPRLAGLVRVVSGAAEGNRNKALYWACTKAVDAGRLDQWAPDLAAAARGNGLPELEIQQTIGSARRAGKAG